MNALTPLETLYEVERGSTLPLPPELASLYGQHDHLIMGLLRAVADAVIVGAGTLRAVPQHHWTAAYVAPAYASVYQELRTRLGKPEPPLNVIVTARGAVSLDLPVFQSGEVPVLLVTTTQGEERIRAQHVPAAVQIAGYCLS